MDKASRHKPGIATGSPIAHSLIRKFYVPIAQFHMEILEERVFLADSEMH